MYSLTSDFIAMAVGAIIALLLWWAPGIAPIWAQVNTKRVTLFVLFLGVPIVVTLLGCLTPLPILVQVSCQAGPDLSTTVWLNVSAAAVLGISALAGSQGGYIVLVNWAQDLMHSAHLPGSDPLSQAINAVLKLNLTTEQLQQIAQLLLTRAQETPPLTGSSG